MNYILHGCSAENAIVFPLNLAIKALPVVVFYAIGMKAGEQGPADANLPRDAELNMMAQRYFKQQGSGDKQNWDLAFENGYADGFKKTHGQQ